MLAARSSMSPVMVGRAAALARLVGLIESAEVAHGDLPSVALVSGEPGIGKTRLITELVSLLPSSMRRWSITVEPGSMGDPGDGVGSISRTIAASTSTLADIDTALDAIAGEPAVLIIEDLHWLDTPSAAALDRLTRQPRPTLVVIGTYRPGELSRGAPGGELVLRLERRHAVEQVRLERLDRAELGALLTTITGRPPTSELVEAMQRRSAGVPFVVEELLRAVGPSADVDDLVSAQLPWSLDEAVRQQIAGLDPDERQVVEAIAVFGRAASFDAVGHVADLDDILLTHALQGLRAGGVVYETSDERFWFTHALVADSVSRSLLGRERRRLHERAFDAVRDADVLNHAALAQHAEGAGRDDEVPAIARVGAARYLERGSTFQALRLAAEALAIVPNDPVLLEIATNAAWRLGFFDEALDLATRWERVAIEPIERIEAMRFVARLHTALGDPDDANTAYERLSGLVNHQHDVNIRGHGHVALAQVAMLARRSVEALHWADKAIADSEESGDHEIAVRARVERASTLIDAGSREQTEAEMSAALAGARRLGDPVLLSRALHNALPLVPPNSERFRRLRAEARQASDRGGFDVVTHGGTLLFDAEEAFADGDLAKLRRAVNEGEQWWTMRDYHHDSLFVRVLLAVEEGAEPVPMPTRPDDHAPISIDTAREAVVLVAQAAGSGDRVAVERGVRAALEFRLPDLAETLVTTVMLVEAAIHAGLPAEWLDRELTAHWIAGHPSADLLLAHTGPLLANAAGRPRDAVGPLAAVLANPSPMLARPLAGSMRTTLAAARLALDDRAGAIADLRRALDDELVRWPGVRKDRALALMRRLEGASARTDGELTAREREVAALLADGLTNGQLAERLYISPKTAAVHVSNILAKLGLANRAEIAAWAVRHQLAEPVS